MRINIENGPAEEEIGPAEGNMKIKYKRLKYKKTEIQRDEVQETGSRNRRDTCPGTGSQCSPYAA